MVGVDCLLQGVVDVALGGNGQWLSLLGGGSCCLAWALVASSKEGRSIVEVVGEDKSWPHRVVFSR